MSLDNYVIKVAPAMPISTFLSEELPEFGTFVMADKPVHGFSATSESEPDTTHYVVFVEAPIRGNSLAELLFRTAPVPEDKNESLGGVRGHTPFDGYPLDLLASHLKLAEERPRSYQHAVVSNALWDYHAKHLGQDWDDFSQFSSGFVNLLIPVVPYEGSRTIVPLECLTGGAEFVPRNAKPGDVILSNKGGTVYYNGNGDVYFDLSNGLQNRIHNSVGRFDIDLGRKLTTSTYLSTNFAIPAIYWRTEHISDNGEDGKRTLNPTDLSEGPFAAVGERFLEQLQEQYMFNGEIDTKDLSKFNPLMGHLLLLYVTPSIRDNKELMPESQPLYEGGKPNTMGAFSVGAMALKIRGPLLRAPFVNLLETHINNLGQLADTYK